MTMLKERPVMVAPNGTTAEWDEPVGTLTHNPLAMGNTYTEPAKMTPERAASILELHGYQNQRPVRPFHVARLASEMQAGRFVVSTIRLVHWDGQQYLTDGQHRLHAIVKSGVTVPLYILHVFAQSADEVPADYSRTDVGLVRNAPDMFRAYDLSAQLGIGQCSLQYLSAGVRLALTGFSSDRGSVRRYQLSSEALRRALLDWAPEARQYFEMYNRADKAVGRTLRRGAVIGVSLVTLRYQPEKAKAFWSAVGENNGLVKGTAERALVDKLLTTTAHSEPQHVYAKLVARCWNSYFGENKRQRVFVKSTSDGAPIFIAGTPYTGKELLLLDYEASEHPSPVPAATE